ncbi:helix-turn-helix transcriptional regulator [Cryptobacterium curtum]|uniref:helix-turn-helix transcriptional regulator n=1 Tax=Cryptobacterium curtum TaxID=84163 RepID=UPI0028D163A2|nr:helix-turn-helix transcriptional regulator [Cryptobacterium curtum]
MRSLRDAMLKPTRVVIGFSLLQCWAFLVLWLPLVQTRLDFPLVSMTISLSSCLLAFITLMLTLRIAPIARNVSMRVCSALASTAGTLLILAPSDIASTYPAILFAGAALIGAGGAWLVLSWVEHLATFGARSNVVGMSTATVIGSLLAIGITAIPKAFLWVVAVLPLASAVLLKPQAGARFFKSSERRRDDVPQSTWALCADIARDWSPRLMTIVSLIGFCFGSAVFLTAQTSAGNLLYSYLATFFGSVIASGFGCFAVIWRHGRVPGTIRALFSAAIALVALSAIIGSLNSQARFLFSPACICGGFGITCLLVWIMMLERSYRRKLPVLGLLASLWLAGQVGILVGFIVVALIPLSDLQLLNILFAAILSAALLLSSLAGKLTVSQAVMDPPGQSDAAIRARLIAERNGLSEREQDVLEAWLKGYTASSVGDHLHISKNTVKTHLKHIYQKTGVTDKEELITLSSDLSESHH